MLTVGGTKVDSFIYSPLLGTENTNRTYGGLMHVTDWFPTILSLAGIDNYSPTPDTDQSLDGYDQSQAIMTAASSAGVVDDDGSDTRSRTSSSSNSHAVFPSVRQYVLYNVYANVEGKDYNISTNGSFAIRDSRYKLMHGYSGPESGWFSEDVVQETDDFTIVNDSYPISTDYPFTYYLFDLVSDPYETSNLYNNSLYDSIKTNLYQLVEEYVSSAVLQSEPVSTDSPLPFFAAHDYFYQPWIFPTTAAGDSDVTLPQLCSNVNSSFLLK